MSDGCQSDNNQAHAVCRQWIFQMDRGGKSKLREQPEGRETERLAKGEWR